MFILCLVTDSNDSGEGVVIQAPPPSQPLFNPNNIAASLSTDSVSGLADVDTLHTTEEVAKTLIEFIITR